MILSPKYRIHQKQQIQRSRNTQILLSTLIVQSHNCCIQNSNYKIDDKINSMRSRYLGTYKFKESKTEDKLSTVINLEDEIRSTPKVFKPGIQADFTAFEKSKLDKIHTSLIKPGNKFLNLSDALTPMVSGTTKFVFLNSPNTDIKLNTKSDIEINYFKKGKESSVYYEDHKRDIELLNSAYKTKGK